MNKLRVIAQHVLRTYLRCEHGYLDNGYPERTGFQHVFIDYRLDVDRALASLPPWVAIVLWARHRDGLTQAEAAARVKHVRRPDAVITRAEELAGQAFLERGLDNPAAYFKGGGYGANYHVGDSGTNGCEWHRRH